MQDDKVVCAICFREFKSITTTHLKAHDITLKDYQVLYPTSPIISESSYHIQSEHNRRNNETRKGVKRSQDVIDKIKQTKQTNPKPSWNKGIPMTEDAKQHLSAIKKQQFASGEIVHWNLGKLHSPTTKEKIKATYALRNQALHQQQEAERQNHIIHTQHAIDSIVGDINATCTINIPLPCTANTIQRLSTIKRHIDVSKELNVTITDVVNGTSPNLLIYSLICNACNYHMSLTNQYFRSGKITSRTIGMCPVCTPRSYNSSIGEQELLAYIASIYSGPILPNDRQVLGGLELDVYLPELKIAFEYTGNYWHSEQIHTSKFNVYNKYQHAKSLGIRIISIFEDEWVNKDNQCKQRISHILGTSSAIPIHARKCAIREISHEESSQLLDAYHIQGSDKSSIKLGAFYEDELISVMTFKPTNMVKGGDGSTIELSRFVTKGEYKCNGIASRLFQYFINNYNPSKLDVISYSDNRWNTGGLYQQLGFTHLADTPPNFWYMPPDCSYRLHRSSFMKHKLVEQGFDAIKTEHQIMDDRGYYRIWDCGSSKWKFETAT